MNKTLLKNKLSLSIAVSLISTFSLQVQSQEAIYSNPEQASLIMQLGEEQIEKREIENRLRAMMREVEVRSMLDKAIPFTPEETQAIKRDSIDARRAVKKTPYGIPDHLMELINVNIEDGKPIRVKVAPGFMSSVVFADVLGNPWTVERLVNANETAFSAEEDNNIITIYMNEQEGVGNLSVRLKDMNTPLILILETDYEQVHGRLEVKLNQMFPGAEINSNMLDFDMFSSSSRHDSTAIKILNMDIPPNAIVRRLEGLPNAFVYEIGEYYYITMNQRLIQPHWGYGSITPSGKRIYRISNSFSRIQVNINGKREWFKIGTVVDTNHTRHSINR